MNQWPTNQQPVTQSKPWYFEEWFVTLSLFLLFPLGLALLWLSPYEKAKTRIGWTVAITAILLLWLVVRSVDNTPYSASDHQAKGPSMAQPIAETPPPETINRTTVYKVLAEPKKFVGSMIVVPGRVFTEPEQGSGYVAFQMYLDPRKREGNAAVLVPAPTLKVKNGDYIWVTGTVKGQLSGQNAFGSFVSALHIEASSVKPADPGEVVAPAIRTITVARRYTHPAGIELTLEKAVFAQDETRLHISLTNNTKRELSLYSHNVKALQGQKQFEAKWSFDGYPEIPSDLLPGATAEGIVVMEPWNPDDGPAKVFVELFSADWNIQIPKVTFEVK